MERIAVLGCGGSGKSYLARTLADQLELRLTHLDSIYFDSNWNALPNDEFAEWQRQLVAERCWVIEGNYASTLAIRLGAADTIILLDLPAWTCLWSVVQRRVRHGRGQHRAIGVYNRISWDFLSYILSYRRKMLPRVEREIRQHAAEAQVLVLRNRRDARDLLQVWAINGLQKELADVRTR